MMFMMKCTNTHPFYSCLLGLFGTRVFRWSDSNPLKVIQEQERPAVADKPARRLRKVRTVYVTAVGL